MKNKALPDSLSSPLPSYWAIIPAAGVGKRMQSKIPKQYLPLAGKEYGNVTQLTSRFRVLHSAN